MRRVYNICLISLLGACTVVITVQCTGASFEHIGLPVTVLDICGCSVFAVKFNVVITMCN